MRSTLKAKSYVMTSADVEPIEGCDAAALYVSPRQKPHPGQWHGIFVHRFLEYAQTRGRDAALRYIRGKGKGVLHICEALDLKLLPGGDPEVGLVIDPHAGTADLGVYQDCEADRHIFCRTDRLWFENDIPCFCDFKTGDRYYSTLGPQFVVTAVGLWLTYSRPRFVKGEVINITLGLPSRHPATYSVDDLVPMLYRLRRVHLKMREVRAEFVEEEIYPTFTPGKHCYTCRARHSCRYAETPPKEESKSSRKKRAA